MSLSISLKSLISFFLFAKLDFSRKTAIKRSGSLGLTTTKKPPIQIPRSQYRDEEFVCNNKFIHKKTAIVNSQVQWVCRLTHTQEFTITVFAYNFTALIIYQLFLNFANVIFVSSLLFSNLR